MEGKILLLALCVGIFISNKTMLMGEKIGTEMKKEEAGDSLVSSSELLTNFELGDRFLDLYRMGGRKNRKDFEKAVEHYKKGLQFLESDNVYYTNRLGYAYHLERRLKEASEQYEKVIRLDPPQSVTPEELELIIRLAPRPYVNSKEFFGLEDVVVILHPDKPLIEYSFFWDDDIGYPGDNDPTDHEKIWIQYDPETGDVVKVYTFFHSAILGTEESIKDAREHHNRALINVQWGTHGSLPIGWQKIPAGQFVVRYAHIDEPGIIGNMRSRFQNDAISIRRPDHPLATEWPKKFVGTWEEYITFDKYIDLPELIKEKNMVIKSRWSNAVIDQYFLDYQFFPKRAWPVGAP